MRIDQFTDEDLQRMRLAVPKVERLALAGYPSVLDYR
jgi:hypothetical protein